MRLFFLKITWLFIFRIIIIFLLKIWLLFIFLIRLILLIVFFFSIRSLIAIVFLIAFLRLEFYIISITVSDIELLLVYHKKICW